MSENLKPDAAPGAVAHESKTNRRTFMKGAGLGGLVTAGALVGGTVAAARAGWLDGPLRYILSGDGNRYRQAAWWSDVATDADMTTWPHFPGDPTTSQFDREKWKVRFFTTSRESYDDQSRELPGAWEAMAFRTGEGLSNVATMPNGEPLFTSPKSHVDSLMIGMTEGPGELRAMPGFWLQEEQRYIPARAGAAALTVAVRQVDVAREMPGAFWI